MKIGIIYKLFLLTTCILYLPITGMEKKIDDTTEITVKSTVGENQQEKKFLWSLIKYSGTIRNLVEHIGTEQVILLPTISTDDLNFLEKLLPLVAELDQYQIQYQKYENEHQTVAQENKPQEEIAEKAALERTKADTKRNEIQYKLSDPLGTRYILRPNVSSEGEINKRVANDIQYLSNFINVVNYLDIEILFNEVYIALAKRIQDSSMPVYNEKTTYLEKPELADSVTKINIPRPIEIAVVNHIIGELVPKKDDPEYSKKVAELAKAFQRASIDEETINSWRPSLVARVKNNKEIEIVNTQTNSIEKTIIIEFTNIFASEEVFYSLLSLDQKTLFVYTYKNYEIQYGTKEARKWVINIEGSQKIYLINKDFKDIKALQSIYHIYIISPEDVIKNSRFSFSRPDPRFLYTITSKDWSDYPLFDVIDLDKDTSNTIFSATEAFSNMKNLSQFVFNRTGNFFLLGKQVDNKTIRLQLWDSTSKTDPVIIVTWEITGHLDDALLFSPNKDMEFAAKIDGSWYTFNFPTLIPAAQGLYRKEKELPFNMAYESLLPISKKQPIENPKQPKKPTTSVFLESSLKSLARSLQQLAITLTK